MAKPAPDPVFPVGFDEDAITEDLDRLPESAGEDLEVFRRELRRGAGITKDRLKSCQAAGRPRRRSPDPRRGHGKGAP